MVKKTAGSMRREERGRGLRGGGLEGRESVGEMKGVGGNEVSIRSVAGRN